jgi:hypothetical protein
MPNTTNLINLGRFRLGVIKDRKRGNRQDEFYDQNGMDELYRLLTQGFLDSCR